MAVEMYVDGSGSPRGGFGWLVRETGESHYEKRDNVTNNQAEYMAILSAVRHARSKSGAPPYDGAVAVYSDSQNTVRQLNHEYAINNEVLRELAMQCWSEIAKFGGRRPEVRWISRKENPAGKMLGS